MHEYQHNEDFCPFIACCVIAFKLYFMISYYGDFVYIANNVI